MQNRSDCRPHKSETNDRYVDFSTVVILVDQIAGVEDATPEPVKAMSAVGRSGRNEHQDPCLAHVSK